MVQTIGVYTKTVISMVKESFTGPTIVPMRVILSTMLLREVVPILGTMEESIQVNGSITKWKVKVFLHGQMAEDMKVNTKKT